MENGWGVVCEYGTRPEAEMAGQILESNGIGAVILSDDCGGVAGGQTFIRGVRVLVKKRDLKKAKELLNRR